MTTSLLGLHACHSSEANAFPTEDNLFVIGPIEGYSPQIGTLVSMLNYNRHTVINTVKMWTSYKTGKAKICNWGDYRVPLAHPDFDIGAGEFSPGENYLDRGWKSYSQAWGHGDLSAKEEELYEWWK